MKELLLKDKRKFIQYVVACFIPVIVDLIRIFIIAMIFESVDRMDMVFFRWTVIACGLFIVVSALLYILSRMLRISYMRDTLYRLRVMAFAKIMKMDYKEYLQKSRDVYMSNLINDINTFEQSFFLSLINFIFRCGLYISVVTILFFINYQIALIVLSASILVLLIAKLYEKKTIRLQKEVSTANEKATLQLANTFTGLEILKLNNMEKAFLNKNATVVGTLEKKKFRFRYFSTLQIETNVALGHFIFMGLLIYLMYQTKDGLGYGELVLTIQLSSMAVFPLVNMMPLINTLKSSKAIYEKITKGESITHKNGRKEEFEFQDKIVVKDINFSYDERSIFKDVSFSLEKGKKYLLKGASGSGKSSLIKLLSGIYDNYDGEILVDGKEMRNIKFKSFYDKVSYIYQDVFLFENTIEDNITLFKKVDQKRLDYAMKASGLESFLEKLEGGLSYKVEENGKNLSGGERQRLSIARALYKQAEILFVDEATSALNDELGEAIEKTILSLDATVVAISHKYFKGITNQYDYVLEIKDGFITKYRSEDYFTEVA